MVKLNKVHYKTQKNLAFSKKKSLQLAVSSSQEPAQHNQLQRITKVALPFLSLYDPLKLPIGIGKGIVYTYTNISNLKSAWKDGKIHKVCTQLFRTTVCITVIVTAIFSSQLGKWILTSQKILDRSVSLITREKNGNSQKILEDMGTIFCSSVYLTYLYQGGTHLSLCCLGLKTFVTLYNARFEIAQGHHLEASGHALMSLVNGYHLGNKAAAIYY